MTVNIAEFNSANLEDRIQIESSTGKLKVYTNGAWQSYTFGAQHGLQTDASLIGSTSPLLAANMQMNEAKSNATALSTGVCLATAIQLTKGTIVTKLGILTGGTIGSPTHQFAALYDTAATPALIGQSTDATTTAFTADTIALFTLTTAYVVPTTGLYYASFMVAGTVPTTLCAVTARAGTNDATITTGGKFRSGTHGSALTGTAPSTIASPAAVVNTPWVGVF
jgi:hypothetical protein